MSALQQVLLGYGAAGGGGVDPYWANVVSLFNGEGLTNGSTSFPDAKSKVWTPSGNAQIQSEQAVFDGTGDYLSTPTSTDFDFTDGDFCVEMFVTPDVVSGNHVLIGKRNSSGYTPFGIGIFSSKLGMLVSVSGGAWESTAADPSNFPVSTQQHVALERAADTLLLLREGSVVASHVIGTDALSVNANNVIIGYWGTTQFPYDGGVRSWRVTKGVHRYGGSYTVPDQYFPTS